MTTVITSRVSSDTPEPAAETIVFSQHLSRPSDGKSFDELAPRNFSFNSAVVAN